MTERFDAVVIGGGHNGLVCGAYLARAGLSTLVLEKNSVVGGAAVSEEHFPGFRFSTFSYLMSLLHPKVIRDLDLRRHGSKYCRLRTCSRRCRTGTISCFAKISLARKPALPAFLRMTRKSIRRSTPI
jgi:phytoene dehydrogenase-like protein